MSTALLTTKLYIPPVRPDLVSRAHLVRRLNAGLSGRLTLISAPAGFGKTTLISEWISQSDFQFCWLSLDPSDNDPGRFLAYIAASLQSIAIEIDPEPIKLIQNPGGGELETILNGMINQVVDSGKKFSVVLDDYHHIQNGEVHHILSYLLEHLPPEAHLVIATRADPPLPIARLRARGQLAEFRSADLRFNISEGEAFLNQRYTLGLQPEQVELLVSRTDGWVAGLQLASIALRGHPHASEYIQRFSGSQDYIVDFLTAEVLEQQPEEIQQFLMRTSILKRLSAPLCEALTGQDNCAQILRDLRANNIFLRALDGENRWFTYHQLFRDLLNQQLFEKYTGESPGLCLKASLWYQEQGMISESIDYALQGEHLDRAADLIEMHAQAAIQQSEITTFIRWVEKIPEDTVATRPELCIYYAWALLISSRSHEAAANYLDKVSPTDPKLSGKLNAVRSIQTSMERDIPKSIALSRQALDQLPEDEFFFRQITGWNLSAALFLSGKAEESVEILEDVARVSLASGNRMVAVVALCRLANIQLQQGDLYAAIDYYQRAFNIASDDRSKPMPVASEALIGLGRIQWEWYQFENARQMLEQGVALSRRWREVSALEGYITLAHLEISKGNPERANQLIEKTKEIAAQKIFTSTGKQYVALQEAYLQLRQGNFGFAHDWAEKGDLKAYLDAGELEQSGSTGADVIRNFELLLYARILLADKKSGDAYRILTEVLPAFSQLGHRVKVVETHVLISLAQKALGRTRQALGSIRTALELGFSADFLRVFLEDGPEVVQLVEQTQVDGESASFAQQILAAAQDIPAVAEPAKSIPVLDESLSKREVEILRLLESDLTVPEIAADIYISVSTLRTHIRNIYRKLDTHSRYETVTRARELNII